VVPISPQFSPFLRTCTLTCLQTVSTLRVPLGSPFRLLLRLTTPFTPPVKSPSAHPQGPLRSRPPPLFFTPSTRKNRSRPKPYRGARVHGFSPHASPRFLPSTIRVLSLAPPRCGRCPCQPTSRTRQILSHPLTFPSFLRDNIFHHRRQTARGGSRVPPRATLRVTPLLKGSRSPHNDAQTHHRDCFFTPPPPPPPPPSHSPTPPPPPLSPPTNPVHSIRTHS